MIARRRGTTPLSRLIGASFVITATIVLASACAPSPAPTADTTDGAATPSAPAPEPTEAETTEPLADPTCDTIIPEYTVTDFESVGWSFQENPLYIGELAMEDGLSCIWADFDAPAGDHLQLFGWAEITADEAEQAQSSLIEQGWIREDAPEGIYITENPETTIAVDDQGYGMTYLFMEGAVKLADTKQGLILVEWPRA